MKLSRILFLTLFAGICSFSFGQKIKVTGGSLSTLSTISEVTVVYDHSEFSVGKFETEDEYLKHRSEEMNEEEAGKGDEWVEYWHKSKEEKYQPKFEQLFGEYSEKIKLAEGSEVIMHVKTIFIEPGFNVGVMRKPSLVDLIITFKKGEEILCVINIDNSPGSLPGGMDFDSGVRIQESYAKAGKELGQYLTKKVK